MKILMVAQYYPPHVGGLEIVAQKQATSLAALGHEVTVVTCDVDDAPKGTLSEEEVTVNRASAWSYLDRRFGLPFAFPSLSLLRKLKHEVEISEVVELHDVFYPTCWAGYFFARFYRKPLLLVQHVGLVDHPSCLIKFVQRLVYRTVGRAIFRATKTIIVFNCNVKAFLRSHGVNNQKVVELRNGIDLGEFHLGPLLKADGVRTKYGLSKDKPIVLFVGRLVPKKGFDALLKASDERYELALVGSGDPGPEARALTGVRFLGSLSQEQLKEVYQISDIFVLPAKGELFTLAMQEAMASGLPIVTSNDPGYANYAVDRKLISFIEPTPSEIRRELLALLGDSQRRSEMGRYSRRLAEDWFDCKANFGSAERIFLGLVPPAQDDRVIPMRKRHGESNEPPIRKSTRPSVAAGACASSI